MAEIGETLREARIRARIDMSEVEARTKIRAKYLRAIENEEWDLLPGPVYAKSFIRTYGDYLGLDSRMLVEEFKRRYERGSDHEPARPLASVPTRERRHRHREPRGPLVPPWAAIGLVLAAIVVALFLVGTIGGTGKSPAPRGLQTDTRSHRPKTTSTVHRVAQPPVTRNVTLELVPTARVYVCLVNGAGRVLIPGVIYLPGQAVPRFTEHRMLLTLGNNGVQMTVNGKPVAIPASASAIGYQLLPTGATPLPPSKDPTCAG